MSDAKDSVKIGDKDIVVPNPPIGGGRFAWIQWALAVAALLASLFAGKASLDAAADAKAAKDEMKALKAKGC